MSKATGILAMALLLGLGHQAGAAEVSSVGGVSCGSTSERAALPTKLSARRAVAACMIERARFTPRAQNFSAGQACSLREPMVASLASLDR